MNRLSKPSWIRSTLDGSRVAPRERPALPGRSPGGRRVALPLDLRVPGEGLPPGTAPGAGHSPGKVLGWQKATATRGGSVLSLHYRDQAVNAGDDGPAPSKSIARRAYLSMISVTFAVKVRWVVARRAPTQGEFQGDQTDAKVGSMPGAARGVRSGHLWSLLAV